MISVWIETTSYSTELSYLLKCKLKTCVPKWFFILILKFVVELPTYTTSEKVRLYLDKLVQSLLAVFIVGLLNDILKMFWQSFHIHL